MRTTSARSPPSSPPRRALLAALLAAPLVALPAAPAHAAPGPAHAAPAPALAAPAPAHAGPARGAAAKKAAPQQVSFARAAAQLVPAGALAALLLDGAEASSGLRALLEAAGQLAPSLSAEAVGEVLLRRIPIDLLAPQTGAAAGLADSGARALVFEESAAGLSAPLADAAAAQRVLSAWLAQAGPVRPTRPAPLKGPLAAGIGRETRAGFLADVAGGHRLIAASGRGAVALASALAHVGKRPADTRALAADAQIAAALEQLGGPALLWVHGEAPAKGAAFRLDGSKQGLVAPGLLLALEQPLFSGAAPGEAACPASALLCLRAAPSPELRAVSGPHLRALLAGAVQGEATNQLDAALRAALEEARGRALVRIDSLDPFALRDFDTAISALHLLAASESPAAGRAPGDRTWTESEGNPLCLQHGAGAVWAGMPCPKEPPAGLGTNAPAGVASNPEPLQLALQIRLATLETALARLSPVDALRGPAAATALAVRLLYGKLLERSGPVTLTGVPAARPANATALELRWPLSSAP